MSLLKSWRDYPALVLASLGLVSGILSAVVGFELRIDVLDWPRSVFLFPSVEMMPIGLFFAAVMAFAIAAWESPAWAPIITFVGTLYAWSAAIQTALFVHKIGGGDASHVGPLLAGICAGFVGAALTHLSVALFARELFDRTHAARTCLVGAIAGILFYFGSRDLIDARILFLVWQPAVAYAIGLGLATKPATQAV
ncbi:MAG TPA: hypothetical protein VFR00_08345 [Hyphomicrobiaceae bacterium]|nr:hypothetical protein [Hyphomicrobiaceae bacterium]